jgi:DNA-binding ferritin-like protein
VFIQDKTCIWAHGKEYFCSGSQNADVTPVVNVPDTATIANNKLTFLNGTDTIVFTVSQRDGTITLTDSNGNTSSATYILKNEFDSAMDTFYTTLESVQGTVEDVQGTIESVQNTLQNQIDDKADKATVSQLNQWKDTVIERLMNINTQPEITIDNALSTTSPNPVENSVITHELSKKANADDL